MKKRFIPIIFAGTAALAVTAVAAGVQITKLTDYGRLVDIKTAIDAAVDETGLYSDEVFVTKAELDKENGNPVYEIELVTKDGKAEYDINAVDGTVVKGNSQANSGNIAKPTDKIQDEGLEEAKKIAFKHAGVKAADVTVTKAKLDRDDGQLIYELEFYTAENKYEYEITTDGVILEYKTRAKAVKNANKDNNDDRDDRDDRDDNDDKGYNKDKDKNNKTDANGLISADEAKEIALEHSKENANNVRMKKAKLDHDDGVYVYEIEFYTASHEYEYEIDAATGRVIEYDVDEID